MPEVTCLKLANCSEQYRTKNKTIHWWTSDEQEKKLACDLHFDPKWCLSSTFWSPQSDSCCSCQSRVRAFWHRCNTVNHMSQHHTGDPVMLMLWTQPECKSSPIHMQQVCGWKYLKEGSKPADLNKIHGSSSSRSRRRRSRWWHPLLESAWHQTKLPLLQNKQKYIKQCNFTGSNIFLLLLPFAALHRIYMVLDILDMIQSRCGP